MPKREKCKMTHCRFKFQCFIHFTRIIIDKRNDSIYNISYITDVDLQTFYLKLNYFQEHLYYKSAYSQK